jgi:hypothetical protein
VKRPVAWAPARPVGTVVAAGRWDDVEVGRELPLVWKRVPVEVERVAVDVVATAILLVEQEE